jgi:hypothetical protein
MTELLRLRGLGAEVEVRCSGERAAVLACAMRDAWSRCLDDGERGTAEAADDPVPAPPVDVRLDEGDDLAYRLMVTTQQITHSLITAQIGGLLMFHAGAVCHPLTGDSLVYVAAGGTGKTTLSRRMGMRFGYLTDETVGIDATGRILPYPKPLSIRPGASAPVKDEVSPDRIGLLRAPPSARVTRVVLLDRQPLPDVSDVQFEEVLFMDAVVALTEQVSSLPALDRPLHRLAALIDDVGPVIRVRYSESSDIEHDLAAMIGGAG